MSPEEIKTEILKHDKEADTVLGRKKDMNISLKKLKNQRQKNQANLISQTLVSRVEENYNIEEVVDDVTAYVQTVVDEMDVDATIS